MTKDCENYRYDKEGGFCLKDIDSARVWDCTAPNKKARIEAIAKEKSAEWWDSKSKCPYPKLGKD